MKVSQAALMLVPAVQAWTIQVPSTPPSTAAGPIDPTFQAFAFEIASFAQYAQTAANDSSPNQFTLALMDEITSRTGGHPVIRIGGTSADYAHYEPGLTSVPIIPTAEFDNFQLINYTLVGPRFFELTKNFASLNATFVIQVPLAPNNISEPVAWAKVAIAEVGWGNLEAFEIGNEPNFYDGPAAKYINASSPTGVSSGTVLGPPGWKGHPTNQSFATDTQQVVQAIIGNLSVPLSRGSTFQPAGLGQPGTNLSANLDVDTFFADGINQNGVMKLVAGHFYQENSGNISTLGSGLMNHSAIVSHMSWVTPFIQYLEGSPAGANGSLPFDMNEVGNSLDAPQNFAFQASLGSALWQVDYQLHLATLGVRRINWQQIMRAVYGMWLPRDSGGQSAQVYSNLYAMFLVGDFIGTGGKTKISQLDISGVQDYQNTVAYVAWVDGQAKRMALVNLNEWPKADAYGQLIDSTPRGQPSYDISGLLAGQVTVKYLDSPAGAHVNASDITYGGSQWTYASGGREVKGVRKDTRSIDVGSDGRAQIVVVDSSAALIILSE